MYKEYTFFFFFNFREIRYFNKFKIIKQKYKYNNQMNDYSLNLLLIIYLKIILKQYTNN